ncbi:type VI protein secretion system component Hcp [Paraburkholderia sp. MM5496-R1]
MGIPAHMWLKDDGGADIKGSSTVQDREGSIELISFGHGVNLPVDNANGRITGARTPRFRLKKSLMQQRPICNNALSLQGRGEGANA